MRNTLVICLVVVILSAIPGLLGARLRCINQGVDGPAATNYATCPRGYTVTGCSCGYACGSYSIQNVSGGRTRCFCHLGCMAGGVPIDWTMARCCKVGLF